MFFFVVSGVIFAAITVVDLKNTDVALSDHVELLSSELAKRDKIMSAVNDHANYMVPEEIRSLFFVKLLYASKFSFLDPSWDWSWYDPQALESFEDHIMEAYAPYRDLVPHFSELVASTFAMQREYVNRVATNGVASGGED